MDVTVQLPTDPVERRRVQNRIAQRKFRHKRLQNQAASSAANGRSSTLHARRASSSNTLTQGTSTPPISSALPSPSLFGCIDLGTRPDGLPTTPATTLMDDFALDAYFDGNFDSCFDLPSLPTEPPARSLSSDNGFPAPVRMPYPGLPTPQATVPSSYASSSSSGRSRGTPVGEGGPVLSVGSASRPGSRRGTTIDMQAATLDAGSRMEAVGIDRNQNDNSDARCDKGWISTIHIAVQSGNERILDMLLRQDTEGINCPDSNGRTPLFHGAIQDNEPVVQMLLAHGARIGLLDKEGRSPLHWAVLYRRLEVLRTLLEHWNKCERHSFDIDAHDNVGWTPLHLAVERRFEAGVLLLMQHGANIKARAKMCPHTGKPIPFNVEPLGS
ncbi:hypothetical protein V2A60_005952 [Cordyceps javanica]|uniref:Ankyrin repeat protein n=1 Tax=Cordyceps javanica TaxID=43265 RepID=A0A545UR65_9HYPO|nr:ankyrin repeat protein [Cordyceps javanica]TQW03899.1 ankyrin repeat protein [Cordyceps javanica]